MNKSVRSLTKMVRREVKCYGLWRKTSTAKTKETVSKNITAYLDETKKPEFAEYKPKTGGPSPGAGGAIPLVSGIDYLSKEERGCIRAYGFLRDDVGALTGRPSHLLENDERVCASLQAWLRRLKDHPTASKCAHKYVLSFDPRFCELLAAGGKDVDALLVETVRTVMRRFRERHYPKERLGYLVGVHHDRKHIHAHVMLFPFTEQGRQLRVTDKGSDKRYHAFRHDAERIVRDYFSREFEQPLCASERPMGRNVQDQLISGLAVGGIPKDTPLTERNRWIINEKRRLQALPEDELREMLGQRNARLLQGFEKFKNLVAEDPKRGAKSLDENRAYEAELRQELRAANQQIRAAKERIASLSSEFQAIQGALSSFRLYSANQLGLGRAIYESESPGEREWLRRLSAGFSVKDSSPAQGTQEIPVIVQMVFSGEIKPAAVIKGHSKPLSRDILRACLASKLQVIAKEKEQSRATIVQAFELRNSARIRLSSSRLQKMIIMGAIQNQKPLFMEQYEGIRKVGGQYPVLCRSVPMEERLAARERAHALSSFEELNGKIMNTLRAFQGEKDQENTFEISRYFHTITDATAASRTKRLQEAEEEAVRQQLKEKSIEEFLLSQNKSAETDAKEGKCDPREQLIKKVLEGAGLSI